VLRMNGAKFYSCFVFNAWVGRTLLFTCW